MKQSANNDLRLVAGLAAMLWLVAPVWADVSKLDTYYQKPGLNLADYDTILLDPLSVSNAKVVPPPWAEDDSPRAWGLNADDIQHLKAAYRSQMKEQLQTDGGYALVAEPTEGALEVSVAIISLTPYAKRDEKVVTKGTGELTVQVQLRDAMSRKLLAVYEGEQQVGEQYQENTRLSAENNLKQVFAQWGEKLRLEMDKDRGR